MFQNLLNRYSLRIVRYRLAQDTSSNSMKAPLSFIMFTYRGFCMKQASKQRPGCSTSENVCVRRAHGNHQCEWCSGERSHGPELNIDI